MAVEVAIEAGADASTYGRPTEHLPLRQLLQLSIYWFGLNAIWGGWEILDQERVPLLAGEAFAGRAMFLVELPMAIVAILVQPTMGCISDYTMTRWGRRKPFILIGATLDVFFLIGIATANTLLALVVFVLLLEVSSNFAQGPFQGYVPDLVPDEQVGTASALVGLMTILGVISGFLFLSFGYRLGEDFTIPTIVLGLIELATAVGTFLWVKEGRVAKPREGKSWRAIALEAWGTDILRERSYVWLLASRFFVLAAGAFVANLAILWMERALGFGEDEKGTWVVVALGASAVASAIVALPAARLSDRLGRKPLIWAACGIGACGTAIFAFAPSIQVAVAGIVLVGVGSGTFIAVDWALLSELVPKAASGRYMGMSQLATALQAVIAVAVGGLVMDLVGGVDFATGPRAGIAMGVLFYAVGALLLVPVVEPRRRRRVAPA